MYKILDGINRFVWGVPALILILGVGIYLTWKTGFAQITLFPKALKSFVRKLKDNGSSQDAGVSGFQALCTALAATVGTGNLAGVAGAIAIGGPGAIFWMWICAVFGMVTKFAEATLAVKYRRTNASGQYVSGPMYMIVQGMGKKWYWLAAVYSFFGIIASFGVGNATQINVMLTGIEKALFVMNVPAPLWIKPLMGILISVLIGFMLWGGGKRISKVAELLVPYASVAYLLLCFGVLACRFDRIPSAFSDIVAGAFHPKAVTGGMLGSAFSALRIGASRGVFTNEAGMGTAAIAHGCAEVSQPVEQGMMGIIEVFLDTIVICTMTALVILCSGVSIPYGTDMGIDLTLSSFAEVYGSWISVPISMALSCFAIATVMGWGFYGIRCTQFLFGDRMMGGFVIVQMIAVIAASVMNTGTVWMIAETVNGLMAIPNLIMLSYLSDQLKQLICEYRTNRHFAVGGTYENFNQRKSLRAFSYEKIPPFGSRSQKAG